MQIRICLLIILASCGLLAFMLQGLLESRRKRNPRNGYPVLTIVENVLLIITLTSSLFAVYYFIFSKFN